MEDLATQIREAMETKGWSLRDVEHESTRLGNRVSFSTVSKTLKGSYSPGERILQGLARALDIPIERLRQAAGVAEPGTPFRLPGYASRLSADERSAIEHVVRVMVEAKDNRKAVMEDGDSTPNTQAGDDSPAQDNKVTPMLDFRGKKAPDRAAALKPPKDLPPSQGRNAGEESQDPDGLR